MSSAARQRFEGFLIGLRGRSAKFFDIPNQTLVAKNLLECRLPYIKVQNRPVAVHFRSDRRIEGELGAKLGREGADVGIILSILPHENVRNDNFQPMRLKESNRVQ